MKTGFLQRVRDLWGAYDRINRQSSTELLEWELRELENIFALVLFGFMVGLPSAPTPVLMDLLPLMDKEFDVLMERVGASHDPLGELFSLLDIG